MIPESLEDIGRQIGAWASGEPDELLDEWYDKYGNQNPNGDPKEILREGLKYQGNGGIIKTERMYRKTSNIGAFSHLPERMSKKHIRKLANKYGIDMTSLTIFIDQNEELLRVPFAGEADPDNIGKISFFPNSFRSEEELVRTLFHEQVHVMQFREFGAAYVQQNRRYFEDEAERLEEEFVERARKEGLL